MAQLVIGYLLDRVREVEGVEPDLLDRALELYHLVESGGGKGEPPDLDGLRRHPAARMAAGLLGGRAQRLLEVGVRLAGDNRELMRALRGCLAERGIDPADPARRAEAVAEYERLLAASVPLERSLENVAAIADTIDLANDLLNPRSKLVRGMLPSAMQALLPMAVKDPEVRSRVEALRLELTGRPERLAALARAVREAGPGIVRGAHERGEAAGRQRDAPATPQRDAAGASGSAAGGSVVASDDRRTGE